MISSVIISGTLIKQEEISRFRKLLVNNNHPIHPEEGKMVSLIPVLYWTRDDNNLLTNYESNVEILIKGHLECDKKDGIYVLVEQIIGL